MLKSHWKEKKKRLFFSFWPHLSSPRNPLSSLSVYASVSRRSRRRGLIDAKIGLPSHQRWPRERQARRRIVYQSLKIFARRVCALASLLRWRSGPLCLGPANATRPRATASARVAHLRPRERRSVPVLHTRQPPDADHPGRRGRVRRTLSVPRQPSATTAAPLQRPGGRRYPRPSGGAPAFSNICGKAPALLRCRLPAQKSTIVPLINSSPRSDVSRRGQRRRVSTSASNRSSVSGVR